MLVVTRMTLLVVALVWCGSALAEDAATKAPISGRLFVLNKSEANVSVIEPGQEKIVATVPVGVGPHEAATSPDGKVVVVCNYGEQTPGSTLTVIDTATLKVKKTIELEKYHRPHGIVFLPYGTHVTVTAEAERKLLIVNLDSGEVEAAIDTDQNVSHMVAVTPDFRRAFVANIGSGSITAIDLGERQRLKVIATGREAEGIAVHPTRPEVWVTNRRADTLTIVDTQKLEVLKELECKAFPIRVAFTPDGVHALVTCPGTTDVAIFDVASRKEERRIRMPEVKGEEPRGRMFRGAFGSSAVPIGVLVQPDGRFAYVANTRADLITMIDLKEWKIRTQMRAGKQPDGLAWVPAQEKL